MEEPATRWPPTKNPEEPKKKVPRPWQWNRNTFGNEALSDFLVNSRVRISRDFKVDDPDDTKWPTPEQFMRVDSEDEWTKLLKPLNQDFRFGLGTATVYIRAGPNATSFRAEPCTSPPPVGARARPSAHRR